MGAAEIQRLKAGADQGLLHTTNAILGGGLPPQHAWVGRGANCRECPTRFRRNSGRGPQRATKPPVIRQSFAR
jgi:hypothetical protein